MSWPASAQELETLGQAIVADGAGAFGGYKVAFGDLAVSVAAPRIVEALTLLRDREGWRFQQLVDIAGADYPDRARRFDVVYHLLSHSQNRRIRVKIEADETTPVASVIGVFPCADWYEREVFDMYGVTFEGHPDLRRILTDYGFEGYPLRKDFPMSGYVEVRYDDELKRVVYEPVKLAEWRNWDFLSPWEGEARAITLPGDEKAEAN